MAFALRPPDSLRSPAALTSSNPWERAASVALHAQAGDFAHAERLLEIIQVADDWHLRDCAVRIFALTAPSSILGRLAGVYEHADYDTRIEAYAATRLTGDLSLAVALARHLSKAPPGERDRVMDNVSDVLEADTDDLEFVESKLDDATYVRRVEETVGELRTRYGHEQFFLNGEPLGPAKAAEAIARLCAEEEPELRGGRIETLFSILEGMTGTPYVGCLDDNCEPVMPKISSVLNKLRQHQEFEKFELGKRYFFGHRVP
ncbi:hypothetical protein HUA76_13990 [Myxococcus sp. CA056]|uniref:hypothetical protein n=1 Tax=Myxococcus sp. CA056 TaxID=2741740 RepID=UPI00157B1CC6|nr:hypothetical protein [Myxococcus sp. CA056]NTX11906.1 hypothetical protein [Myxococcus sp. CA056]